MRTFVFPKGKAKTKDRAAYDIAFAAASIAGLFKDEKKLQGYNYVKVQCNDDGELQLLAGNDKIVMIAGFGDTPEMVGEGFYLPVIGKKEVAFIPMRDIDNFPDVRGFAFDIGTRAGSCCGISSDTLPEQNIYEILRGGGPLILSDYLKIATKLCGSWDVDKTKAVLGGNPASVKLHSKKADIYIAGNAEPLL